MLKIEAHGTAITPDVAQWLSALAAPQRQDFGEPLKKGSYAGLYSNTFPWAGGTNAISALVSNDPQATRFQDEAWNKMIAEIHSGGVLRGELGRGQRAVTAAARH